jgi:putative nucleotidyltransferase with HDIG domain
MWRFPFHSEDASAIDWLGMKQAYSWVNDMEGVEQDPVFHAEGDVWTHTKMVVTELLALEEFQALSQEEKNILFAAAILHDVEKRSTTERVFEDGRWKVTSKGHAKKGERTARNILYRDIPTPFRVREEICKLVRYHALPIRVFDRTDPRKEALKSSLSCNNHLLAVLARADMKGRISLENDVPQLLYEIDAFVEQCNEVNCYGKKGGFASDLTRFLYFQRDNVWPQQETFDDTTCNAYIMCGVPGSGKDHYITKHLSHLPVVSMDNIRREQGLMRNNKHDKGRVIQAAKESAKEHLRKKRDFVWNATSVTKSNREDLISLFLPYKPKIHIVYVERPYDQVISDNKDREHPVKQAVIDHYLDKLEVPDLTEAHTVTYFTS